MLKKPEIKTFVGVRIQPSLIIEIKALAKKYKTTLSEIIRQAIEQLVLGEKK